MPLYEGLGSGGEKTAVVIDLGEAFTNQSKLFSIISIQKNYIPT
uniref:ARP10 actin-related protein 10 n=1 Tax=Mus musculus TaxID=10090 RepID=A0A1Y7VM21_MOUSE